ncbi:helix-turn-helix domain-containing protein [Luedemannella helvata]|uniref:Helix-turn-helix domain-containing protein n=1 Tax=Luedemannella helvata TaxID=349315 RepID=A0ABP4X8T9_9ACTN
MTDPTPAPPAYYRAADVAQMLRCSQWWIKEQARNRRIPYTWIGGSYLFTPEHVTEIVRRFEVQPVEPAATIPSPRRRTYDTGETAPVVQLRARIPRRARVNGDTNAA